MDVKLKMKKYLYAYMYLCIRLAKKGNPKLPYKKYGDSILWSLALFLPLVGIFLYKFMETFFPNLLIVLNDFPINLFKILLVIFFGLWFFNFYLRDQWEETLPYMEKLSPMERKKICWRVIIFLFFLTIITILLFIF